jgi:hypothetical protein
MGVPVARPTKEMGQMARSRGMSGLALTPRQGAVDSPQSPNLTLRDLVHDVNNDLGVAIGVLDTLADSVELSARYRHLAETGLQRLIHAQAIVRGLPTGGV